MQQNDLGDGREENEETTEESVLTHGWRHIITGLGVAALAAFAACTPTEEPGGAAAGQEKERACCLCEGKGEGHAVLVPYLERAVCEDSAARADRGACRKIVVRGGMCTFTRVAEGRKGKKCERNPLQYKDGGEWKDVPPPPDWKQSCERALVGVTGPGGGEPETKSKGASGVKAPLFCSCRTDPRDASRCIIVQNAEGTENTLDGAPRPAGASACDRTACAALFGGKHHDACPLLYGE